MAEVRSTSLKFIRTKVEKVEMTSKEAALESARDIIYNIIPDSDSTTLTFADVTSIVDNQHKAVKVFDFFDLDKDGVISETDLQGGILKIRRERKRIQNARSEKELYLSSLLKFFTEVEVLRERNEERKLVKISNRILNIVFGIIIFSIAVVLGVNAWTSNYDWTPVVATIGAILVALSYSYYQALQDIFDCLYMLYIARPFGVGDRIIVTNNETAYSRNDGWSDYEELVVEEVGVLTSKFRNANSGASVYMRNGLIVNSVLVNLSRGGRISVVFDVAIRLETSKDKVKTLKSKIEKRLEDDPVFSNKLRLWTETITQGLNGSQVLRISVKTRQRWRPRSYDWKEYRSELMTDVNAMLLEMNIASDS